MVDNNIQKLDIIYSWFIAGYARERDGKEEDNNNKKKNNNRKKALWAAQMLWWNVLGQEDVPGRQRR